MPSALPEPLVQHAQALHAAPPRHYHTWDHALQVAYEVERAGPWEHPVEVLVAALFHDAVYVVGRPDNERLSAEAARAALARWLPDADADLVAGLIEATAAHGRVDPDDVDEETARFLDCDMAILGAHPDLFDAYDRGVAREWAAVVSPEDYALGRRAFLERLLARERLFLSDVFHERLDAAARANLRRALGSIPS